MYSALYQVSLARSSSFSLCGQIQSVIFSGSAAAEEGGAKGLFLDGITSMGPSSDDEDRGSGQGASTIEVGEWSSRPAVVAR